MSLSAAEFQHLCRLARLNPDEETGARFAAECDAIIAYMDKLAEVDSSGVEPLYAPVAHGVPLREDEPLRRCAPEDILANAPLSDGEFFVVPRIVEGR